jgi:hypothetical protein
MQLSAQSPQCTQLFRWVSSLLSLKRAKTFNAFFFWYSLNVLIWHLF